MDKRDKRIAVLERAYKELCERYDRLEFDNIELSFEIEDTQGELDFYQKRDDLIAEKLGDEWLDTLADVLKEGEGKNDD